LPVFSSSVSVGTTAVEVVGAYIGKQYVYLQDGDFDGDTVTYVGASDVSAANGIKLSKETPTVFETYEDDPLHAISSAAGGSVRVLRIK
jgi:hypothetical protein